MALAIRFDQLIRDGVVSDQAELARIGHVSRARLTQIANLLCLAPDVEEALLFLPATERGRDPITERQLRAIAAEVDWGKQRRMWRRLKATLLSNTCEPLNRRGGSWRRYLKSGHESGRCHSPHIGGTGSSQSGERNSRWNRLLHSFAFRHRSLVPEKYTSVVGHACSCAALLDPCYRCNGDLTFLGH